MRTSKKPPAAKSAAMSSTASNNTNIPKATVTHKKSRSSANASAREIKRELIEGRRQPAAKDNTQGARSDQTAKIKKLQAEINTLRKASSMKENVNEDGKILRPAKGVAGNGFCLQTAMRLQDNKPLYSALRRCVRDLGDMAGLDCSVMWPHQPKEKIGRIIAAARARQPYFKRFPHGWAVEEFLKTQLKNKRQYARRHGFLSDIVGLNTQATDEEVSDMEKDGGDAGDEEDMEKDGSDAGDEEEGKMGQSDGEDDDDDDDMYDNE